ncbi:MAG TPA: hypothetical protein VK642_10835 [Burkholderiales bacterium]|nr:hypothetical protein [Burkholderiales bacterium]
MSQSGREDTIDYSQHPEYAIAALLKMLVRYPMVDCDAIAGSIAMHLQYVAGDDRYPPVVRQVAAQSGNEWEAMMVMRAAIEKQRKLIN